MAQKKGIRKFTAILLLMAVLIGNIVWSGNGQYVAAPSAAKAETTTDSVLEGIQGVWISFLDYKAAGLYNKTEKKFTANADAYFKKLKKDGINTVYFHVVPCNDAIYPSEYLSWSTYMFKSKPKYDALEILSEKAHKYNMTFHAWINPYRKTMKKIYNPGKASSTNRIVRIVKEIIQNYDVDGIHFDDYFYPSRTKGAQLYNVSVSKRKKVINKMVKKVYSTVKEYDEDLLFGISPAGAVDYAKSIGCDLKTWLSKKGYMDYVIPQIYWSDQYKLKGKVTTLFTDRLNQWVELNKNDTPMYIGLGLYRGGNRDSSDLGWKRKSNNIVSQIKKLKNKGCDGFVFFSSSSLYAKAPQKEVKNYRKYIRNNKWEMTEREL